MDLLEKFSSVEIKPTDCMTEADRQFCQRQQEAYQDAVTGFYQIGGLLSDMYRQQKAVLFDLEDRKDAWREKYLVSSWWREIDVNYLLKHIFSLHTEFIDTLVSYLNAAYHLSISSFSVAAGLLPEEPACICAEDEFDWSPVVLRYEDAVARILAGFNGRTFAEEGPYELLEQCHSAAWLGQKSNFSQQKNLVKILNGACGYGYYSGHEQWHIHDSAKSVLKALAHFETGILGQYPDGIADLLSEEGCLWFDLWELEDCKKLEKMLRANGIGVIFEKENINTLTESSEFLLTLFSGFAQAESESISKNVIWGIQKSREAGNVPFQYSKLLGYRRGSDGQPEIVPEEAEVVKRIYRRYLDGCSLAQIKRELEADGVPAASGIRGWTYQVVRNILTNERYIGDALLQKTYTTDCISKTVKKNQGERSMVYVEKNHPAIVSKAMFYQVREEMARRSSKRKVMQKTGKTEQGKYSAKYALSELLVCGECGTPYKRCTWARNGKKRIVWRCISRLEFGKKYCHSSPSMDEDGLHQAILGGINEFVQAGQGLGDELLDLASIVQQGGNADEINPLTLRNRLDALTAQQAELLDKVLEDMDNTELTDQLKAIAEEKQAILGRLGAIQQDEEQRAGQEARLRDLAEWLKQQQTEFSEYDDTITRRYVERITVVDAETIRIKFRYTDVEIDRTIRK